MAITIGMGHYIYDYHGDWARLPRGLTFQAASAVAVDSQDRVYVDAHHIYISADDHVYLADRDAHQVLKYTPDGTLVMRYQATLQGPFNYPSDIVANQRIQKIVKR